MTGLGLVTVLAALPWLSRRSVRGLERAAAASRRTGRAAGGAPGAGPTTTGCDIAGDRQGVAHGGRAAPTWRWLASRSPARARDGDAALLLDLVAVALAAGAPVPTALSAVGSAWPGAAARAMVRAARALMLGAPWDVAWAGASGAARAVAEALEPAWLTGASPVPLLRTAADRVRSRRRAETRAAAGRLGVQLVVPLGLCYLPAFVLVGLVPVVVSLASGLFG